MSLIEKIPELGDDEVVIGSRDAARAAKIIVLSVFNTDQVEAVVEGAAGAPHLELDAGRACAERLELLDLMNEPPDLRFVHLHRAEFDAVVDGKATNDFNHSSSIFQRAFGELFEGIASGRNRFIDTGKNAIASRKTLARYHRRSTYLCEHLGDDITNQIFVDSQ